MTQESAIPAAAPARKPEPRSLYEKEMANYRATLESDLEGGLAKYGFALFHCLPGEERFAFQKKLGIPCRNAAEHYNMGCALASKEDFAGAIESWKQALKMNPALNQAVFNIALALERMGKPAEARKQYTAYLQNVEDPEEKAAVEAHLGEIQG